MGPLSPTPASNILPSPTMPVAFNIADHEANEVDRYRYGETGVPTAEEVVSQVWSDDGVKCEGRALE